MTAEEICDCCTGIGPVWKPTTGADVSGASDLTAISGGNVAVMMFAGELLVTRTGCVGREAVAVRAGVLGGTIFGIVPSEGCTKYCAGAGAGRLIAPEPEESRKECPEAVRPNGTPVAGGTGCPSCCGCTAS